ncbi:MAG: peptidoglycan DD-metalloendopeptidase family protein [Candidatus Gastranaerophilales bacterium]|nr:peptidoglycan DD-metalloendopeptidase family protein [Candidatus Gastranaerophilales bacterium]
MDCWVNVVTGIGEIIMNKKAVTLLLFIVTLFAFEQSAYCANNNNVYNKYKNASQSTKVQAISNLKKRQADARVKANRFRMLERVESGKLYNNQRKLESTRTTLINTQNECNRKLNELNRMKARKAIAEVEYVRIYEGIKSRIRQIYKTQRKGFFELLLTSSDINMFIDRLHYEEIVMREDYKRMKEAQQKAEEIARLEECIAKEQRSLDNSRRTLLQQQRAIKSNIAYNEKMIHKLRTNRAYYERSEAELAKQSASLEAMLANRTTTSSSGVAVTTGFIRPVAGKITSPFGYRTHPIFHSRIFHSGIDIGAPMNTPIKASNSGKVIMAGWYGGYGKVVIIDHGVVRGQPITTLYGHLNSINVSQGQRVNQGQMIGRVGTTGYSTGPHCHFEVRVKGQPRNPLNFI